MKNKQLFELEKAFEDEVLSQLPGVKFALVLEKNEEKVKNEVEKLRKVSKPSEKYIEYEKERLALCSLHCEKNEDGTPRVNKQSGTFVFTQDSINGFEEEFKPITTKYADEIKAQQKKDEEFAAVLEEEADIELSKINEDNLPEGLTLDHIRALKPIINME